MTIAWPADELHARARVRARELATWQCDPQEIVAVLEDELEWTDAVGTDDETGEPVSRARQWAIDHAPDVTRWRLIARVKLREEIWAVATGAKEASAMPSARKDLLQELMRQHCGWAKQAPLDQLMDAYFAAQRDRDRRARQGGKGGRAKMGVVA